jgi:broad specificity phosphatase PhoE
MLRILIVRPGATTFDDQGRIKGALDMPLSTNGAQQVERMVQELADQPLEKIYCGPCQSARQTAEALARGHGTKCKVVSDLQNVDHGLWEGKLIEELRRNSPSVYRAGQESAESVCPPDGEAFEEARKRLTKTLQKLLKKHRHGSVALVIPDPLASLARAVLCRDAFRDLWQAECDQCRYEVVDAAHAIA